MAIAIVEFYQQSYEVGATIFLNVKMEKQTGEHKWS